MAIFFGLNIIFAWNRVQYSGDFNQYGYLTIANGGLALLFGSRNNLLSLVARVPSTTLLMFHRWVGRAAVFYASLHLYGESRDWIREGEVSTVFANTRIQVGLMAWLSLALIFVTSLSIMRRQQFEVFYYAHALFIAFIIGALIHADHAPEFLLPGLCLWALDRVIRFSRNFRRIQILSVTPYAGGVMKIKIRGFKTSYPGQIAWIQISEVSFLNWHPFTVASAPGDDEAMFLIRGLGGYTRRVHDLAKKNNFEQASIAEAPFPWKIRVDGPYGVSHTQWEAYPVIVLVAGGVGITPGISIASHILRHATGTGENIEGGQPWHVHLLWVIKDEQHVNWCQEELQHLFAMSASPTVQATFDLTIAITGSARLEPRGANDEEFIALEGQTSHNYDGPGELIRGRPNIVQWFRALRSKRDGLDGAVNVCGPRSLISMVRTAAAELSGRGGIFHLEEEVFEF
ncbi:hypothetical protein Asppvi_000133 [Aspergillus pseudoviridinutans]|uniref:FAD-binding FR-type domain-containing protein n=1 Tax=Aspergillus pseudoviridinutans TaxID=1517512 RepID=A0A9P3B257_9EURO|nr:uncharacterized protein Asppvi_000133 [Aspergillus pseudoviridinutans]GIJ81634.1 hypothetical protein Asppvi_000133 [Aspergillus pseudoviridinutans]